MEKQRGGITGKGFQPGQSGNPGGRRPSLKNAVAKVCGEDGEKLVAFWALILWGKDEEFYKQLGRNSKRTLRDRMDAATQLADRGYTKPTQEISGPDGGPLEIKRSLADLTDEELAILERLAARDT